jgi:hypothetical protein
LYNPLKFPFAIFRSWARAAPTLHLWAAGIANVRFCLIAWMMRPFDSTANREAEDYVKKSLR